MVREVTQFKKQESKEAIMRDILHKEQGFPLDRAEELARARGGMLLKRKMQKLLDTFDIILQGRKSNVSWSDIFKDYSEVLIEFNDIDNPDEELKELAAVLMAQVGSVELKLEEKKLKEKVA